MNNDSFRIRAEIDLDAISKNIKQIQKGLRKGVKTCAVIKADGYGHGAVSIAKHIKNIVDFFATATIEEAIELRENGISHPILVLGYVHHSMNEEAIRKDVRLTVYDFEMAKKISEAAVAVKKNAKIHIKLDTGMSRIGFFPNEESLKTIVKINSLPNIEIEGLFTHLYAADERSKASAMKQILAFGEFINDLSRVGISIPIKHCSNSAAAINLNLANYDMVRLGIAIYGLYPSRYVTSIPLRPAMSIKSHITMVKTIPKGTSVSYGATWKASEDTVVATVPVGYADGYMRVLSGKSHVLIHGKKAPVIGRVCMDQLMVDVTKIPKVKKFDEVVLLGKQKDAVITAEEIAALADTINYEFVCGINKRVPRIYLKRSSSSD